jgi:glycosyltransferase involved in cell wall biosynthesis
MRHSQKATAVTVAVALVVVILLVAVPVLLETTGVKAKAPLPPATSASSYFRTNKQGHKLSPEDTRPLVTFIIPSINRVSLNRTLLSLTRQRDAHWTAVVAFDGITPDTSVLVQDPRITFLFVEKKRGHSHKGRTGRAGKVRNYAIRRSETADWVAFVDDDDTLDVGYVEALRLQISAHPSSSCFIFSMRAVGGRVYPSPGTTRFVKNDVGISFAYKRFLFDDGFKFQNSYVEDFELLDNLRAAGVQMTIVPDVMYYVGHGV